ncbi:MAG: hypothetical protein KKD01_01205 [Proteobacteria bacterium]|nr:hypothetical protein [Pseudomonadota bacterium]MBU1418279.1 hypothetical protein [Pseudomonadota bacterium]MBU1453317.1 hypothetical protein [Pseudomonadota bacterium]
MSNTEFKLFYCGPALENGKMNVRDLAPALMAVGSLLEESNRVLNGGKASVSVNVKAFEDGSFGILFNLDQSITTQVMSMFTGDQVTAAINILTMLGFAGGGTKGLIHLLRKSQGQKPIKAKKLENGDFQLYFKDGQVLEITKPVLDLYTDLKVRAETENVINPLNTPGITGLRIGSVDEECTIIQQKEAAYFTAPEDETEEIEEQETTTTLSIQALSFKEDNKWRFSDGSGTFYATITDKGFLTKVHHNQVSFTMGDLLKVQLIKRTKITGTKLNNEYEVTKIIEHRSAARQLTLPFE